MTAAPAERNSGRGNKLNQYGAIAGAGLQRFPGGSNLFTPGCNNFLGAGTSKSEVYPG